MTNKRNNTIERLLFLHTAALASAVPIRLRGRQSAEVRADRRAATAPLSLRTTLPEQRGRFRSRKPGKPPRQWRKDVNKGDRNCQVDDSRLTCRCAVLSRLG